MTKRELTTKGDSYFELHRIHVWSIKAPYTMGPGMAPKTLIRVIWCPSAYDSWAFGTLLKSEKKKGRPLKPNTMTHNDENVQSKNYSLKSSLSYFHVEFQVSRSENVDSARRVVRLSLL